MLLRRVLIVGLCWIGCAPQSADRATLTDAFEPRLDARPSSVDGRDGGGAGGIGGIVDTRPETAPSRDTPPDRLADRPVDRAPDSPLLPDTMRSDAGDAIIEAPPPAGPALLVVGDPAMPSAGDTRLRGLLAARGFDVQIVDDNAAVDVGAAVLVVIAGSCASATLTNKYKDVPVPVVDLEAAVFDDMGLTAGTMTDLGEAAATNINIAMTGHPMAAGLGGNVGVVTVATAMGWGRPAPAAQRVATMMGMADRVVIFGYPRGAAMVAGTAAARRVGFFANDAAAPRLSPSGVLLFQAAVDWALMPD